MGRMNASERRAVEQSRDRVERWLVEARRLADADEGDVQAIRVEIVQYERALAAHPRA